MHTILIGDAREQLATIPDGTVQTCVTSPPYYGLRDYNVDGQIGLERTVDAYVAALVDVFREVRRVLRDDGTLWLNLGDSYATHAQAKSQRPRSEQGNGAGKYKIPAQSAIDAKWDTGHTKKVPAGLKDKDLIGVPWRVAFALQADGWYLRSEIIWHKPNPMPESVTDRPTKAHETVFLLSKGVWTGCIEPAPMSEKERAWLAAMVDAEGSIVVGKSSHGKAQISVQVANTSQEVIDRCQAIGRGGHVGMNRAGTNMPVWGWQVTGPAAAAILYAIKEHLIIKRGQAEIALSVQEAKRRRGGKPMPQAADDYERWAREACSSLNQRQPFDLSPLKRSTAKWTGGNYYYDAEAIAEPASTFGRPRDKKNGESVVDVKRRGFATTAGSPNEGRNKRSVWTVSTTPYSGAHFAVFPPKLIEPCILAGTSERGQCRACGAPWVRVVERENGYNGVGRATDTYTGQAYEHPQSAPRGPKLDFGPGNTGTTKGWAPSCACDAGDPVPQTVIDPFAGSGTTGAVAERHGRHAVLIELNPEYRPLIERRLAQRPLWDTLAIAD